MVMRITNIWTFIMKILFLLAKMVKMSTFPAIQNMTMQVKLLVEIGVCQQAKNGRN